VVLCLVVELRDFERTLAGAAFEKLQVFPRLRDLLALRITIDEIVERLAGLGCTGFVVAALAILLHADVADLVLRIVGDGIGWILRYEHCVSHERRIIAALFFESLADIELRRRREVAERRGLSQHFEPMP